MLVRRVAALAAVLLAACNGSPPEPPQVSGAAPAVDFLRGSDWPSYNRDLAGTRFSPLDQISPTNVDELRQAWSYPLAPANGEPFDGSELTPLVVDGVLYATAGDRVVALRGDTGAEVWRFALPQGAPSQRGLAYWPGDAATPPRVFFTAGRSLFSLDAATGEEISAFGTDGAPPTVGELTSFAERARPILEQEIEDLRALEKPRRDRKRVKRILAALEDDLAELSADPSAALIETPFAGYARLASAYGFQVCGTEAG